VSRLLIAFLVLHIAHSQYGPPNWHESAAKPARVVPTDTVSKAVVHVQDYLTRNNLTVSTSLADGSISVLYRMNET